MIFKYKKCGSCNEKILKSSAIKSKHGYFCSKKCCQDFHELLDDLNKSGLDNCCG